MSIAQIIRGVFRPRPRLLGQDPEYRAAYEAAASTKPHGYHHALAEQQKRKRLHEMLKREVGR